MKRIFVAIALFFSLFLAYPVQASENPLDHPNNKFGVHILFPSELPDAAKLVNSNGGDWGYVTIPIQAGDKDVTKWQDFLDQCGKLHIIPIIRLATEGDYFNTAVWRKPSPLDILDFANFLGDLHWPTKNQYIIVFNEVNRGDEWGGQPNAGEYADILTYAVTVFKSVNPNFFIISAGMDNAAANTQISMNEYSYYRAMNNAIPGIFNQVDGFGSHSYPNPAFSTPPWISNSESIASFQYEKSLINQFTSKNLPVFITETGWSTDSVAPSTVASYYQQAFTSTWSDSNIVAITPFLLKAGGGPFQQFSLENPDGTLSKIFKTLQSLPKIKGVPDIVPQVLAASSHPAPTKTESFSSNPMQLATIKLSANTKFFFKWLLHMN